MAKSEEPEYMLRPPGEVVAFVQRPIARFGVSITFGVRSAGDGHYWVGHIEEDGQLRYRRAEAGTAPDHPTLYLSDEEQAALHHALNNEPVRFRGDAALDHLQDALKVRDRLLDMVESEWKAQVDTGTLRGRIS